MVNQETGTIICTAFAKGSTHDFKLYEQSVGSVVSGDKQVQGDKGYHGIAKLHKKSQTSKKKPKGGVLTKAQQEENKCINRERMFIEHINAKIKMFKITSSTYRNRYKRFGLRMMLLCGIINFEYHC